MVTILEREALGLVKYHGPACRCGSRATKRVGRLTRKCEACGTTYAYRLYDGLMVPLDPYVAQILDEGRNG